MEEIYIKNLNNWIRAIKLGTKTPSDVGNDVSRTFIKLRMLNDGMASELMNNYKAVVEAYNKKNPKI